MPLENARSESGREHLAGLAGPGPRLGHDLAELCAPCGRARKRLHALRTETSLGCGVGWIVGPGNSCGAAALTTSSPARDHGRVQLSDRGGHVRILTLGKSS